MTEIAMPRLSDSMEEGTIIRWLVSDGSSIDRGQEIVEIETDKASMTHEADAAGVLHIIAAEGDTLPVGAPIAQLLAPGEEPRERVSEPVDTDSVSSPQDIDSPADAAPARDPGRSIASGPRVKASPLARRMASAQHLDLAGIQGSGPGGRIIKADVERAPSPPSSDGPGPPPPPAQAKGQVEVIEPSRIQALIARRMAEAKATIPEFTLQREIDMERAVELRGELKALAEHEQRPVPSFNDMVVRACALALREFPRANGSYRDGHFELHKRINIGVAVAAPDAVLVPSVHDADERSLWEIARQTRELAAQVRDGTITPPQLAGGTFSVSNLGMFGIDSFTAVINPPQAAILAVGALARRPVVRDGDVVARHTMTVTLTCDHRILYGAGAAEFLERIRSRLERPLSLLG
jgi:pyruvate dehydrogenase E2 component (dihydrolipoamide acetyltransferase)